MNDIVMGIPGRTMADSLKLVLEKTGNFRPHLLEKEELPDTVRICKEQKAQQLLLYVSVTPGYTIEEQKLICKQMRSNLPACKIVILVDELLAPESAQQAKQMKQDGMIDSFIYASSGLPYLTAMLETV